MIETNAANIESIITRMNTLKKEVGFQEDREAADPFKIESETPEIGFSSTLAQALDQVNSLQMESGRLKSAYEEGDPNVSLVDVTLASQKAGIGFDAAVRVRNKFVEAYKEVMNMPV